MFFQVLTAWLWAAHLLVLRTESAPVSITMFCLVSSSELTKTKARHACKPYFATNHKPFTRGRELTRTSSEWPDGFPSIILHPNWTRPWHSISFPKPATDAYHNILNSSFTSVVTFTANHTSTQSGTSVGETSTLSSSATQPPSSFSSFPTITATPTSSQTATIPTGKRM